MTFCIGIKVRQGVVLLADTRITRGSEQVNKQKLAAMQHGGSDVFTMTSGLRSVRDKTLTYLDETIRVEDRQFFRMYELVNQFGEELRRVRRQDGPSLESTGHRFNLNAIIAGRLDDDAEPQMFWVYPEGNWVEAAVDSPYFIIGRTYYGKPILDRLLTYETPLSEAVALALLAMDATRESVNDVDYPIDVAVLPTDPCVAPILRRFTANDLAETTDWWDRELRTALQKIPMDWARELLSPSTAR